MLQKIHDYLYEIPCSHRADMLVPVHIYVNEHLAKQIQTDRSLEQITNVASLPGIQKYALAMPDVHEGYGFPIGGVAAMAINENGVISPGGIGYDINCGVRLLSSQISHAEIKPVLRNLATRIFSMVPSGVGQAGNIQLKHKEIKQVLLKGAQFALNAGYGEASDLEYCEENGCFEGADPTQVSKRAYDRGHDQLGTLGSGNHFLEIQVVDEIWNEPAASAFGLYPGCVTAMIHCGSRGLGHQVCTDFVKIMLNAQSKWGFQLADRQLAAAPFLSQEGQNYFAAMKAAANFAWANRHIIAHQIRKAFEEALGAGALLRLVYDVAHNIGKIEQHLINGESKQLIVHRKGATRAFGPGSLDIPQSYRSYGQPVLIPGTMGTASYVLTGAQEGLESSFGSTCHGSGRAMSRTKAKKSIHGAHLRQELEKQGIVICSDSDRGLAEEAPVAYKDIEEVVSVVENAKLANRVARLRPIAVIKGD